MSVGVAKTQLQDFEREFGQRLPDEYREFLLEWNGAAFDPHTIFPSQPWHPDRRLTTPTWDVWTVANRRDSRDGVTEVSFLYGLNGEFNLRNANTVFDFDRWIGNGFLSIGQGAYPGYQICIYASNDKPYYGQIFDWVHPEEAALVGENCPDFESLAWAAMDFREFWTSLRTVDENEFLEWESFTN